MQTSGIEWLHWDDGRVGLSWTPVRGCLRGCPDCWAKSLSRRFPEHYAADFVPSFHEDELLALSHRRKPARIGVCFTADLLADWTPLEWLGKVLRAMLAAPQHEYLMLTQDPETYQLVQGLLCLWSDVPNYPRNWPANWWAGATIKECARLQSALDALREVKERGGHTFLSLEPLLEDLAADPAFDLAGIDWVIIGALTGLHRCQPKARLVINLLGRCTEAGVPVFAKDNLFGWRKLPDLRQFPLIRGV